MRFARATPEARGRSEEIHPRFTTFISGYNTAEQPVDDGAPALSELTPEQQLERVERVEQFSELHFVQVRGAGVEAGASDAWPSGAGSCAACGPRQFRSIRPAKGQHVRREIAL